MKRDVWYISAEDLDAATSHPGRTLRMLKRPEDWLELLCEYSNQTSGLKQQSSFSTVLIDGIVSRLVEDVSVGLPKGQPIGRHNSVMRVYSELGLMYRWILKQISPAIHGRFYMDGAKLVVISIESRSTASLGEFKEYLRVQSQEGRVINGEFYKLIEEFELNRSMFMSQLLDEST